MKGEKIARKKRDKAGEIYFLPELNPLWTIRNSTCTSFITILCDYKCVNVLPESDGNEMNRKREGSVEI